MAQARKRSSNSAEITVSAVEQATAALQALPDKPKDALSLREAVLLMHDPIAAALSKGYSYDEVATMLSQTGVEIQPSSLRYYLSRIKRETSASTRPTRTRKPRGPRKAKDSEMNGAAEESPQPETTAKTATLMPLEMPEVESAEPASAEAEAPKSRKRTRTTTGTRSNSTTKTAAKSKPRSTSRTQTTPARRGRKKAESQE